MRSEKEIKLKIEELREKAFTILERNQMKSFNKRISIRTLRLIIDALDYSIGKNDDLLVIKESYNKTGKEAI